MVVYESVSGNTKVIAETVADALSGYGRVELGDVAHAATAIPEDLTLLVVGATTQEPSLGRGRGSHDDGPQYVTSGRTLKEWLAMLHVPLGYAAVAFDTRVKKPFMPGTAAKTTEKRLNQIGFRIVVPAESFILEHPVGPLRPGEVERARLWGTQIGAAFARR